MRMSAHGLGGNGKEVSPILVGDYLAAQKPDTEFVDEHIWLQRTTSAIPGEDSPQVNMHGFEQSLAGLLVAISP